MTLEAQYMAIRNTWGVHWKEQTEKPAHHQTSTEVEALAKRMMYGQVWLQQGRVMESIKQLMCWSGPYPIWTYIFPVHFVDQWFSDEGCSWIGYCSRYESVSDSCCGFNSFLFHFPLQRTSHACRQKSILEHNHYFVSYNPLKFVLCYGWEGAAAPSSRSMSDDK